MPAITSLWAVDLVRRAAPQPGERVLDVACGTGIVARLAAKAMGTGRVLGLDINSGMLAVARSRPLDSAAPTIEQALDRHLGAGASTVKRSEHSLCDAGELHRLVAGAGFRDIRIQPVTQMIKFPSAREYVRLQLAATPQASLLKSMNARGRTP